MNMELIIHCRPRQAILKFANRYPNAKQNAVCTALAYLIKKIQRFRYRMVYAQTRNKTGRWLSCIEHTLSVREV